MEGSGGPWDSLEAVIKDLSQDGDRHSVLGYRRGDFPGCCVCRVSFIYFIYLFLRCSSDISALDVRI